MTRWGSATGTLSVTLLWSSVMWHAWIAWVWNLMLNLSHETTVAIDSIYNCEGIFEHLWRLSYKSFTLRSKVIDNVKRAIWGASNFIPCSGDYWRTAVIVHGRLIFDTLLRCRNVYIAIIFKVSAASIDGHWMCCVIKMLSSHEDFLVCWGTAVRLWQEIYSRLMFTEFSKCFLTHFLIQSLEVTFGVIFFFLHCKSEFCGFGDNLSVFPFPT